MKHLLEKTFVMVDLETLSTKQNGVIVQIGAVKFTVEGGLGDEFLVNIDSKSSLQYGLNVEQDTLQWWAKQPEHIRKSWQVDKQTLPNALNLFNNWLEGSEDALMMANGSVFDFGILRSSYEVTGINRPWPYWNEMDLRTIATLLNIKLSKGNDHNALGDAKNQAKQFIQLFKE